MKFIIKNLDEIETEESNSKISKILNIRNILFLIVIIGLIVFCYYLLPNFSKNMIFLVIIIGFTSIFHFTIGVLFKYLRKKNFESETLIEHMILFACSYIVWILIDQFYYHTEINNQYLIDTIIMFFTIVPLICVISAIFTDVEYAIIVHILGYIISVLVGLIFLYYFNVYIFIIDFILLILMYMLFKKKDLYDN